MPTYKTTGIVLGRTNFGEADRILRLLTPEHGKLSAIAKGVRRIKSRLGGHLELFGETSVTLATGRNLDIIASARLNWYPHRITGDYRQLSLAYLATGLTDRVAAERQPQPELYAHLLNALQTLDNGAAGPLLELWFKLRLLSLAGYRPELGQCVTCGSRNSDETFYFNTPHGGIICSADAGPADRELAQSAIKLWRLLCDYPYTTIAQISGAPALAAATLSICDEFCEHHLGRAWRSDRYLG
jgi:DNA repair protein RecO (recombination protein O)